MIELARPGFLLAGAAAALVPLVLHLIARRLLQRVALPTARFLRAEARSSVRIRRWPTDIFLLAMRMLLLVMIGAALAGPARMPVHGGLAEIVLLDRSTGAGVAWNDGIAEARRLLIDPDGGSRGSLVIFDTAALVVPRERVTVTLFDSLHAENSRTAAVDYSAAFRAVADARRSVGRVDSLRVTLISSLRWDGWRPGLERVRNAAWSGAFVVVDLPRDLTGIGAEPGEDHRRGTVAILSGGEGGLYTGEALQAAGWTVGRGSADSPPARGADAYVVLTPVSRDVGAELLEAVRGGATLLLSDGAGPVISVSLPWDRDAQSRGTLPDPILFAYSGFADRVEPSTVLLRPDEPEVIAVWADGTAAAAARREGAGCVVWFSGALERESFAFSEQYPRTLDRLIQGCSPPPPTLRGLPLDRGAREILAGGDAPAVVAAAVPAGDGTPLGRWILAGAFLLALLEAGFAHRMGRRS
ncbi:hypothetical protein BH23GEM3_BH23GEM3_20640 [soil metagenome]